ncbi:MAG TPA: polyhydroxyalkanoate depolymerase [Trinickia sp.]|jgi:poly(3-hydroxybutyrate) depolymerase|uniref:polyhydroxyalkanoate depolymerase n=1 Tax=Trinickia sp. TaxID=2571163 RepID=UPI002BE88814|nr:polyhydroxyalkanoate depolymerase [Trinickia sp.]HTI18260.1 polyhydroxyalkanoate depolymerase [Trinickia sp.]
MMYNWLEAQRALMRSMDASVASIARVWGMPAAYAELITPPGCEWLRRLLQTTPELPPFGIESISIDGRPVRVEESIADRTAFCTLRRFAREGRNDGIGAPILLCPPLAGHHAVMLRETVETLLQDADVYVNDWANARDVPLAEGPFGLDDYVMTIERFMRQLCGERLHVLAVCQGTVPTVAAAALIATNGGPTPTSITLMGGPVDTRLSPTTVNQLATAHSIDWFRNMVIDTVPAHYRGAGRRIYPGYIQHAAIVAAHPDRQWALESRYWTSLLAGDDANVTASQRLLSEYASVLDMTEEYFLETLRVIFKEQQLAHGTWEVGGQRVKGDALASTALCTVEGDCDDITGAGQTHAAHTVCRAVPDRLRVQLTVPDCGHYDLFTGPRWREVVHPALVAFWHDARKQSKASPS